MPKSVLSRAHQLFRRRKFSHVIQLLESQVFRYRNNEEFYALLGSACLYTGDFGGAESYLRRAEQLNEDNAATQLGLAAIAFKRGQTEEALNTWLKVIDLDPGNKKALKALEALRRSANWDGSVVSSTAINLRNVLPSLPARRPWAWIVPTLLACAVASLILMFFLLLPRIDRRREPRPGVEEILLSSVQPLIAGESQAPAESSYSLSEKEISETFETIKGYLLEYRDNLAIREINRLLLSNASTYVKEKAGLMKTFVQQPDFSTIRDPFPYIDVQGNPALYADSFVVWRGKAANVRIGEQQITFDLLVGYQDEKELLGLVPVTLSFASEIENGDGIEVLGKVEVLSPPGGHIRLQGLSIHRLYRSR